MSGNPNVGPTSSRLIPTGNLTSQDFAPYGQVIQNPARRSQSTGLQKVIANQGSATKWLDVTHMTNWYDRAESKKPANVVMNMFVCKPRTLQESTAGSGRNLFPVKILERHPYTPQTFIPLGVAAADDEDTRYLVIVAPTLQPTEHLERDGDGRSLSAKESFKEKLFEAWASPFTDEQTPTATSPNTGATHPIEPKGPGKPDLDNIQAFIARGDQAVTYGPGTWHAPMVVLGQKDLDFVVVQYANGVSNDDCQEFDVTAEIAVDVNEGRIEASGPGIMRAKL